MFTEYEPGAYINFVSPTPLLMIVALGDHLTVAEALAAYERALEPKKLVTVAGGHVDAYVKDFEGASTAARETGSRLISRSDVTGTDGRYSLASS
jgi:hypothetical protein